MSRPSDGRDEFATGTDVLNPQLGPREWLRWAWRQLTSMRTALLLLLALAVAAVPGSLLPQQSADPNGVIAWRRDNPGLVKVVEVLQGFEVYTSVWFSAIYLLLFISLVGCVVPRLRHHLRAARAAPPRTPSNFGRLPASAAVTVRGVAPEDAVETAERVLRRKRYRVVRYGDSVSAERGYLRESGNLLFHGALVGVLITVFIGGGFTWTGQVVVPVGQAYVNDQNNYDSLNRGRWFTDDSMSAYSLKLDRLDVRYEQGAAGFGAPLDYTAHVTTRQPGAAPVDAEVKVNHPLDIAGTSVYLLGNGYAPVITVRNPDGSVAWSGPVPFRPTEPKGMTSFGVVKAPDTTDRARQIGLAGFLYPTPVRDRATGELESFYPAVGKQSVLSFFVYEGDVGLDSGIGRNVYDLDTSHMKQVAGRKDALQLGIGQTKALPDGLGTVTVDRVERYAAFDVHHDPSQGLVATFVALAVLGLITSLLVPRRRMWARATRRPDGSLLLEYAALARGDDPGLERAVADLRQEHVGLLEPGAVGERAPTA